MFPTKEEALKELEIAEKMNPGPWVDHVKNVGLAAENIAKASGLDPEKALACGLMHDIGRRYGVSAMRHIIDGYNYMTEKGWDEAARICLTHSFPVQDITSDIAKRDITKEQYDFIDRFLKKIVYDDYDKLIILCDSLADANGFCILEKRFVDTTRRYGTFPSTIPRWNNTIAIKEYFEEKIGGSVYQLLPGIENCIYR